MKKQPQTTRHHMADANCKSFHYTQEEIDHVQSLEKERNGHFDEFPLLPNEINPSIESNTEPIRHFMDGGSWHF